MIFFLCCWPYPPDSIDLRLIITVSGLSAFTKGRSDSNPLRVQYPSRFKSDFNAITSEHRDFNKGLKHEYILNYVSLDFLLIYQKA